MTKYWAITRENFKGEDDAFYFESFEIAKENFDTLCEKNKNQAEFERSGYSNASWFDPDYNEYSTYIELVEIKRPAIYNKIIF